MKKFTLLLLISSFVSSCSDGDLVFDELNFSGNIQKCSTKDIFYKLNGNEMLFTYLPGKINNELPLNEEITYFISNSNDIVYRQYGDKTVSGLICEVITPSSPQVVEEFKVNIGGQIKYKRFRRITLKETDASVNIGYIYSFNFHNIILSNGSKELKYENYNFGEYIDTNSTLHFKFFNEFTYCDSSSDLITLDNNQALKLIIPSLELSQNTGTSVIDLDEFNYIQYQLFKDGSLNKVTACDISNLTPPLTLIENWKATQGNIEIVTTENPNVPSGFSRTFILKNGVFKSESDSFLISEKILGIYTGL